MLSPSIPSSNRTPKAKTNPWFTNLNDLASSKVKGKVVFATDDRYALAENLLQATEPEWKEGVFTEHGKWMDGWSTGRNEDSNGRHWCIIELGVPGVIRGIDINTLYFSGNFAEKVSIQAANLRKSFPARRAEIGASSSEKADPNIKCLESENWTALVPRSDLKPGYPMSAHNYFEVDWEETWTHIRLNIFPDGGIARLHVYGQAKKDWSTVLKDQLIDLVAMENGGICVGCSSASDGHARNLLSPGPTAEDGWETRQSGTMSRDTSHDPVSEWAIFKLGHTGVISKVEVDTSHFKGNFPDSCKLEACLVTNRTAEKKLLQNFDQGTSWKTLLPLEKLSADNRHTFMNLELKDVISHVRLTVAPYGGLSRLRLWGYPQKVFKMKAKL